MDPFLPPLPLSSEQPVSPVWAFSVWASAFPNKMPRFFNSGYFYCLPGVTGGASALSGPPTAQPPPSAPERGLYTVLSEPLSVNVIPKVTQ